MVPDAPKLGVISLHPYLWLRMSSVRYMKASLDTARLSQVQIAVRLRFGLEVLASGVPDAESVGLLSLRLRLWSTLGLMIR